MEIVNKNIFSGMNNVILIGIFRMTFVFVALKKLNYFNSMLAYKDIMALHLNL